MEWQASSLGSPPSKPSPLSPAKLSTTRRIESLLRATQDQPQESAPLSKRPLKRSVAASQHELAYLSTLKEEPTEPEQKAWPTEPTSARAPASATAEDDVVDLESVASRLIAAIEACEAALALIGYDDATSDADAESDGAEDA